MVKCLQADKIENIQFCLFTLLSLSMSALALLLSIAGTATVLAQSTPPYTTYYHKQRLDHFNPQNSGTFQQRYLVYNGSFNASKNLILFYAGNEGPVDGFYNNTGLMYVQGLPSVLHHL